MKTATTLNGLDGGQLSDDDPVHDLQEVALAFRQLLQTPGYQRYLSDGTGGVATDEEVTLTKKDAMKTAIIFDGLDGVQLLVVDGDFSSYDAVYIGDDAEGLDDSEYALQDELLEFLCEQEPSSHSYVLNKHTPVSTEEFSQAIREGALLIVCGVAR